MTGTLREVLPATYAGLLPDFFERPAPGEKKASCDRCAMCQHAGDPPRPAGLVTFSPDTKCCTYHPKLPGYLVGAILDDTTPELAEGRRRIREHIHTRVGVTPEWLAPPRKFWLLLEAARTAAFGRTESLLCPYFERERGLCTIWRHRESDCSTFFCKYDAGADGQAFWRAFRSWLVHVEQNLANAAVQAVAPGLAEPRVPRGQLTLEDVEDRPPSDAAYASWWKAWAGREEELYVACHRHVTGLGAEAVARLAGSEGGERLLALERAYRTMTEPTLPVRLRLASDLDRLPVGGGQIYVTSYSRYEPTLLSENALALLSSFTADELVDAVRARLERDHEVTFDDELLQELHRLRILVAEPAPEPPA